MKMKYKGVTFDLPDWCTTWSENALRESLEALYQESLLSEEARNAKYQAAVNAAKLEAEKRVADTPVIQDQLREAGYTAKEIKEIIYRWQSGQTLDSAMQTVSAYV